MLQKFVKTFGGNPNKREIEKIAEIVEQINAYESELESVSDEALRAKTDEFRARLAKELEGIEGEAERRTIEMEVLDELLPQAFAVVREASKRTVGQRPYDHQPIGSEIEAKARGAHSGK